MELGNTPTFHVLLLGGEINASYGFTSGGDTQEQLGKYRADWAILSVDGVSAQGGITTCHSEEAIIDRLMMANAKKRLIAATGNKIGIAGFSRICDGDESLQLITDATGERDALLALQERGVKVIKV
jgi:DeoR/GlpR family transcriptional regulator of sugar metabolism